MYTQIYILNVKTFKLLFVKENMFNLPMIHKKKLYLFQLLYVMQNFYL